MSLATLRRGGFDLPIPQLDSSEKSMALLLASTDMGSRIQLPHESSLSVGFWWKYKMFSLVLPYTYLGSYRYGSRRYHCISRDGMTDMTGQSAS